MTRGNYDSMLPSSYMHYYPHQFNLLFIIKILFSIFGIGNYQSFQYMNALLMPLLFYSGYKIIQLICSKSEVIIYYVCLFVTNIPLFLYVSYVYGEIPSITFTMVLMWMVILYCKKDKTSCLLWGTLAMVFSYMTRNNSLIILIAVTIVLLINAFKKVDPLSVIWFLGMFLVIIAVTNCIKNHYEKISGYEVSTGVPYIAWVYMGLNDGQYGPGWFDASNCYQFEINNYNTELAAQDSINKINSRLEELWNNKEYAVGFFKRKILSQWIEPTCHSYFETSNFICKHDDLPAFVHHIYFEYSDTIKQFENRYQSVLYFYAAIMVVSAFFKKKEKHLLENHILLISFVGGFLFHIFWEVMGRYALPYMVYLIPMAAVGMGEMREIWDSSCSYILHKFNKY